MARLIAFMTRFWVGVVATLAAGIFGVWAGAEAISGLLSYIVVEKKGGIHLNGEFALNTIFCFISIILILYSFYSSFMLYGASKKLIPSSVEATDFRSRYDEVLSLASGLTESIYPSPANRRRVDITRMKLRHEINKHGDAKVIREYDLRCPAAPAHIFGFWIEMDDETPSVDGFRNLNISVKDLTLNRPLYWLPTNDNLRKKKGTIFFPEMSEGETKKIELTYECKGYLNRLLQKEICEFSWDHKCASPDATADIICEWAFDAGFPIVSADLRGDHSPSAKLAMSKEGKRTLWTYTASSAEIDDRNYKVFMRLEKG